MMASALADELLLIEGGTPRGQIFTAPEAGAVERYAARELQEHLEKISGARLPQASSAEKGGGVVIAALEGQSALAKEVGIDPATLGDEEVVIQRRGDRLWLVGKTPRAALYATYTFLHDHLDCRWLWPGPEGEFLPQRETITVGDLAERQQPSLRLRSLGINHPHHDEATDTWMARQRMNYRTVQGRFSEALLTNFHERGFEIVLGGHGLTLPQALLDEHPEYAAEVGGRRSAAKVGRRQPHLCWSNAEVRKALAQQLREKLHAHPQIDVVALMATDHTLFCECAACHAMAEDVSTRWQLLCTKVIAELQPEFPAKRFRASAYQAYRALPSQVAPLDYVAYCAYNANYLQPMFSSDTANAELKREMLAWKALGAPVGLRGYEMIPFSEPMWTPLARYIVDEKRWLRDNGFAGSLSEVAPYGYPKDRPDDRRGWTVNRLTLYAAAQAMWNADRSVDALLKEWMETLYGPAASQMIECYRIMETAWTNQGQPLTYFLHPPTAFSGRLLTAERVHQVHALFSQAEELLRDDPRRLKQLALERRMFENWREAFTRYQNKSDRYRVWAVRAPAEAPQFPAFEERDGRQAPEGTEVEATWNDEALTLRFLCRDAEPAKIVTKYSGRDENLFTDDNVELYLQWGEIGYAHMVFNSAGARYDALTLPGGGGFDTAWNPDWQVRTERVPEGWRAEVTLPFAGLGVKPPAEGGRWRAAIKRSRPSARRTENPDLKNSGWPDASYHNAHGFGELHFVREAPLPKVVILYHIDPANVGLQGELLKRGLSVKTVQEGETALSRALAEDPALVLIRVAGGKMGLSDAYCREELLGYMERGGVVVLSAGGAAKPELWFDDPKLAVEWSGWTVDKRRRTSSWTSGEWVSGRFDLASAFGKRIAPASAFRPLHPERWETLASLRLQDQTEAAYLLKAQMGRGALYLTSSAMTASGGGEIFGRHHPANAAGLLDNLVGGVAK